MEKILILKMSRKDQAQSLRTKMQIRRKLYKRSQQKHSQALKLCLQLGKN